MIKSLTVSVFLTAALAGSNAYAFVPSDAPVPEQSSLKPPAALLVGSSAWGAPRDEGFTFLGRQQLADVSLYAADANPLISQVVAYFQQATGADASLELKALDDPQDADEARVAFVQTVNGVPIAGTYALAQVRQGHVTYAQAYLVRTPRLITTNKVSADVAVAAALADARTYAKQAHAAAVPAELTVLYTAGAARLVWQVTISTEEPLGVWLTYVDAQNGQFVSRHNDTQQAVQGTLSGSIEPACQGDTLKTVLLPHMQWMSHEFTDAEGAFAHKSTPEKTKVTMKGRYFDILSLSLFGKSWNVPLVAAPAHNDVVLQDIQVSLLDPYYHANTARTWAQNTLKTLSGDGVKKTLAWMEKTVPIVANVSSQSCNAAYLPMFETLAFFSGEEGKCNNAAQIAKVVYHEYGHGVHHHLTGGAGTFDGQISEGAGDYVASTLTNSPEMTGLLACKDTLPTRNKAIMRTCKNHYSYCKNKSKCDSFPADEVHTAAPVICGAFWDLREALSTRYGAEKGVATADAIFLKFLTMSTDMQSAYSAALAADDDQDGDPSNGTTHSCEINQAFVGGEQGLQAHFPDSVAKKVPCKI